MSTLTVNNVGGWAEFANNADNGALYGFAGMLYPGQRGPPPEAEWAWGTYYATSQDSWSEEWKAGQAKPTMKYDGGYSSPPATNQ